MTPVHPHPAPRSNVLKPELPTFAPPVKFGDIPERRRVRLTGHYRVLLCDHCGEARVDRCTRDGLLQFVGSLAGYFPHKCPKCKARQSRLLAPWRLMSAIALAFFLAGGCLHYSGVFRVLKPEPRTHVFTSAAEESSYYAEQRAAIRRGGYSAPLQTPQVRTLRNEDVAMMLRTGIDRNLIQKLIWADNADYDLSPAGLAALRKAGADDNIIRALTDRVAAVPTPN